MCESWCECLAQNTKQNPPNTHAQIFRQYIAHILDFGGIQSRQRHSRACASCSTRPRQLPLLSTVSRSDRRDLYVCQRVSSLTDVRSSGLPAHMCATRPLPSHRIIDGSHSAPATLTPCNSSWGCGARSCAPHAPRGPAPQSQPPTTQPSLLPTTPDSGPRA